MRDARCAAARARSLRQYVRRVGREPSPATLITHMRRLHQPERFHRYAPGRPRDARNSLNIMGLYLPAAPWESTIFNYDSSQADGGTTVLNVRTRVLITKVLLVLALPYQLQWPLTNQIKRPRIRTAGMVIGGEGTLSPSWRECRLHPCPSRLFRWRPGVQLVELTRWRHPCSDQTLPRNTQEYNCQTIKERRIIPSFFRPGAEIILL
jgi:hypothetical protein